MQNRLAIVGTDTGVGKTHITTNLCLALRTLGQKVWLHKPVACGNWADNMAEDIRDLLPLLGDGQPLESLCRGQWPAACSPHLAARLAGEDISLANICAPPAGLHDEDHLLLVEGAGGIAVELTTDGGTICDLCTSWQCPTILVTRPHLGTLNHTKLSVAWLQQRGIACLGLVLNEHEPVDYNEPAIATVEEELEAATGLKVLARFPFTDSPSEPVQTAALSLAEQLFPTA